MNAYIAYGTKDYLQKLYDSEFKNANNAFLLASNNEAALIQETTSNSSPFKEGSSYEIIESHGSLSRDNFVDLKHILTTDEAESLAQDKLKQIVSQAKNNAQGLQAARVYKPSLAEKYILLTAWNSQSDLMLWNNSDKAKEFNKFIDEEENAPQSLLEGGSFSKNYFVISH